MSNQLATGDTQRKRPLHISVASLGTNASGLADSTISFAGSDWSGISQFPSPPAETPTPTLTNFGTPTSFLFAERLPPSIPDFETPTRFQFGTPPTRSPTTSLYPGSSNGQNVRSVKSTFTSKSGGSNVTVKEGVPPVPTLESRNGGPVVEQSLSPSSSLPSQPSTSSQSVRPLTIRKDRSPYPPVTGRAFEKRPETPQSVAAASSLLDWSDADSGISINPSEERLLTTSFITSLLSQSPEPFPGEKLSHTRSRLVRRLDKGKGDAGSQASRDGLSAEASSSHRPIPPFYPSDLLPADGQEVPHARTASAGDRRSLNSDSESASKGYFETLHSDEGQVHSVVRKPSISFSRGGIEARPVGVVPAYHISYGAHRSDGTNSSLMTSNNSMITSTSMASKPPVHHADAPRNVRQAHGFDGDGIPRESEEDFVKFGGADLYRERPEMPGSPALPSTAGSQNRFTDLTFKSKSSSNQTPGSKYSVQRNHSMKSVVSSIVSRISNNSVAQRARYMAWLNKRPLPPLPMGSNRPPEFPNGKEIQKSEEAIPLPTLAKRAEDLSGILNKDRFPSGSDKRNEFHYKETTPDAALQNSDRETYVQFDRKVNDYGGQRFSLFSRFRRQKVDPSVPEAGSPSTAKLHSFEERRRKRRLWIVVVCVIIGVILAIAIPVGLSQRKENSMPVCKGNETGASCTLDATCVCTSGSGSCKPLALSLSLLVPDVNALFTANFTEDELSDAVVDAVGTSSDGLCTEQALLVDVEPGLNSAAAPNRTKWAQAAILWNLGMSEDISATTNLQKFVSTAPWDDLPSVDGPTEDGGTSFTRNVSGFTFDFASQSVTPLSAYFIQSSPSDEQLTEVSDTAEKVLDRMYSFAIASSTQRGKALTNYWTSVLQQQESDLYTFIDAVQNSPFFIPFDATSSPGGDSLTNLMLNTSSTQFPVPVACYPGLDSTQLARINAFETVVFGLDTVSSTSNFTESCFPNRPVYGVVDLLRLRLPFPDDREGVALQACALSKDATIRTVIYSGEVLSALPGATVLPDITTSTTDPREFGTASFLNHVLLNYLSSISNVTLAIDLVSHVLSSGVPANNSDLANSLSSLPVLEFAVFGSIRPQDIASSVSSFSTRTGSLFFGSDAGQTFRSWALVNTGTSIAWAESAISSEAVHENSLTDPTFESVWQPASELVAAGSTDASDVQKVASSLKSLGLFSS